MPRAIAFVAETIVSLFRRKLLNIFKRMLKKGMDILHRLRQFVLAKLLASAGVYVLFAPDNDNNLPNKTRNFNVRIGLHKPLQVLDNIDTTRWLLESGHGRNTWRVSITSYGTRYALFWSVHGWILRHVSVRAAVR